jgi:hypothetical protein
VIRSKNYVFFVLTYYCEQQSPKREPKQVCLLNDGPHRAFLVTGWVPAGLAVEARVALDVFIKEREETFTLEGTVTPLQLPNLDWQPMPQYPV